MKKILYVGGDYDYSTDMNTEPVMKRLTEMGAKITSKGGSFDFFIPDLMDKMVDNWHSSVPDKLADYDIVYFADFWNMAMPFFNYKKYAEKINIPFVSLFNGSVTLRDDVATPIPHSDWFEKYLTVSYDRVIIPAIELSRPLLDNVNYQTCCKFFESPLPTNIQFERIRPEPIPRKRVIFSHRFNPDKGCNEFIDFVIYCQENKYDIEFFVTQDPIYADQSSMREAKELGVKFTGKLPWDEFKQLCADGGFAWSSAYSETFGYAILDLVSFGLTPLLNDIPAYHMYSDMFKYHSYEDAVSLILSGTTFTQKDWEILKEKIKDGDKKMAEIIYNAEVI